MISRRTHVDQGDRLLMMQEEPPHGCWCGWKHEKNQWRISGLKKKRRSLHIYLSKSLGKYKQFEKETLENPNALKPRVILSITMKWMNGSPSLNFLQLGGHNLKHQQIDPRLPNTLGLEAFGPPKKLPKRPKTWPSIWKTREIQTHRIHLCYVYRLPTFTLPETNSKSTWK